MVCFSVYLDILKFRKIDFEESFWFDRLRLRLKFQKESSGLLYMYLLGIKVYIDSNKPQTSNPNFDSVYVLIYLELFAKCLISFFSVQSWITRTRIFC